MPRRKVITIDEKKCNGCGDCVTACAEGAIALVNGKARLVSEVYCDGLGACLGHCPKDAITIEEREAPNFDEAQVRAHLKRARPAPAAPHACPGSMARALKPKRSSETPVPPSALGNWPVQLRLIPPGAGWLAGADLLLAADCVPFAYADFHRRFLRGKPVIVACPKLDPPDQNLARLTEILKVAAPRSVTIVHMEVPCCGGITRIAQMAAAASGIRVPLTDITIGIGGEVLAEVELGTE
jgi:Pyruvate/2-oxoacid:ferredoxin oxidoreductase delta subunit